jgi:plastocyanin
MTIAIVVIIIVLVAGVAGYYLLGKGSSTVTSISIPNGTGNSNALNFSPQSISVVVGKGNTITFTNNDNTLHTVTFTSAPSGVSLSSIGDSNLMAGQSYTVTLTVPGTYQYHCTIHSWMSGTIVVNQASPSSGGY